MADWKVSREIIEVMDHPNAERLDICRVGQYPIVCQKGLHKNGSVVIFIPEKSVLPENLQEGFKDYLRGPNKDRVGSIRLRGEPSMGIVIPDRVEFSEIPIGEDLSEKLGIVKYEPPMPQELAGKIKPIGTFTCPVTFHDVEQFSINKREFVIGEEVMCTEKLHGSQVHILRTADGNRYVSSKGLIKRQFVLEENDTNAYWQGVKNSSVFDILDECLPNANIEVYAELVPVQKNYSYGFSVPMIKLFDIRIDGEHMHYDIVPPALKRMWVPVVYRGPYVLENIMPLCEGTEGVSGQELHIKEGIVLRPVPDRRAKHGGFRLMVKILNPKYKETGEEIN